MLGHLGLDEQHGTFWVEAGRQPIDGDLDCGLSQVATILIVGGQRMPIGYEVETTVLILKPDPVLERSHVVAQVEPTRGPHAAQYSELVHAG